MRASVCMTAKGMGAMDRHQRNGAGSGARTRTALRLDQAWLGQPSPTAALLRHAALGDNRRLSATPRVTRFAAALLTATALTEAPAWAVDVSTETQLRNAIFAANGGGDSSINITANITLTQSLPMITSSVTVTGNGNTLDANNAGRAFFVQSGTAAISNLTINNAVAQGGAGGPAAGGGGGGLGAGAAMFVNTGAAASLTNVTVGNASATGGAGGGGSAASSGAGGGGGLGGAGGTSPGTGAGGGGGYAGAGGNAVSGNAAAGGGGEFGAGGNSVNDGGGGG